MSELKLCLFCGQPLNGGQHGNSHYCDQYCYYSAKTERTKNKYWESKASMEAFQKSDKILKMFHDTYSTGEFVSASLLDQAGMDWLITKGEVIIDELPVKVIGDYGYSLFKNETIKIWKILNRQQGNQKD